MIVIKKTIKINKYILFLLLTLIIVGVSAIATFYVLYPYSNRKTSFNNEVSILSYDGLTLRSELIQQNKYTHKWAVMIHSYRTNHTHMYKYGEEYYKQGYNVLLPDNRAHGSSDGSFIGMGYLDQYDILKWIDYIISLDSDAEIVLHGISMGGATIMMLSGQENLPENIKVLIEDCGYTSATEYLTWKLKQRFHLPSFPLIPLANLGFKAFAGYYMDQASAIDGVSKCELPIMFIHGTEDTTVNVANAYNLYDKAVCDKGLYIVEGAGHCQSMSMDPEKYWSKVFGFIENYVDVTDCEK